MGLGLEVGILADLKDVDEEGYTSYVEDFARLNIALRAEGLGEHVEPDDLDEVFSCDMMGYSRIHCLRRIAMHLALGHPVPAPGNRETDFNGVPTAEYFDAFGAEKDMKYQHLIVHSDADGFYVPIDFERVICTPSLQGSWVGSTQRLRAECAELASMLGIPSGMDYDSDELSRAVSAQLDPGRRSAPRLWPWKRAEIEPSNDLMWKRYAVEADACLRLLTACEASLLVKAAIVFC
jgi:hypothetical protein